MRTRLVAGGIALPLLALTVSTPSASAASATSPGRFTGYGFDACQAPSQSAMNELRRESPFWGVGVYIGGRETACSQPNLTATWVKKQRALGWKIMPIFVDRQSACADRDVFDTLITTDNSTARKQGAASARTAIRDASRLRIARGSTLFLDIEAYDNVDSPCNQAVMSYLTGWNRWLAGHGYKGGLYASAASGIRSLDNLMSQDTPYTWPSAVWIAHGDGRATTRSEYLSDNRFRHQRAKQYALDVDRTYGSVTLRLDINKVDIGGGAKSAPRRPTCGVRVDFPSYRQLQSGSKGSQVKAAQCLLKTRAHLYQGKVSGRYDAKTARSVARLQKRAGLAPNRVLSKKTWVALHAVGSGPLVKIGSNSDRVRDLQHALSVALNKRLSATSYFDASTTRAVRSYQAKVGVPANGIVGPSTWQALKHGKR